MANVLDQIIIFNNVVKTKLTHQFKQDGWISCPVDTVSLKKKKWSAIAQKPNILMHWNLMHQKNKQSFQTRVPNQGTLIISEWWENL